MNDVLSWPTYLGMNIPPEERTEALRILAIHEVYYQQAAIAIERTADGQYLMAEMQGPATHRAPGEALRFTSIRNLMNHWLANEAEGKPPTAYRGEEQEPKDAV